MFVSDSFFQQKDVKWRQLKYHCQLFLRFMPSVAINAVNLRGITPRAIDSRRNDHGEFTTGNLPRGIYHGELVTGSLPQGIGHVELTAVELTHGEFTGYHVRQKDGSLQV